MSTCRHCGARIRWVITAKRGKAMPLDAEPTPEGNMILRRRGRRAVVLDTQTAIYAVELGTPMWRAHFASCEHKENAA